MPRILHRELQLESYRVVWLTGSAVQPHLATLGELDGVAQQIGQHLAQPPGIAHRLSRQAGRDRRLEFQALGARLQGEHRTRSPRRSDCSGNATCSTGSFPASMRDRSRMSLINASSESAERLMDSAYSCCSPIETGAQQKVRHPQHAVHGRADLVAHVRQEPALHPRGFARRDQRRFQLFVLLLQLLRVCPSAVARRLCAP